MNALTATEVRKSGSFFFMLPELSSTSMMSRGCACASIGTSSAAAVQATANAMSMTRLCMPAPSRFPVIPKPDDNPRSTGCRLCPERMASSCAASAGPVDAA